MSKRAIYYDDCSDAERLAREYTRYQGATWSPAYQSDIGKFAYEWTANADFRQMYMLASFQPARDWEVYVLWKKHTPGAATRGHWELSWAVRNFAIIQQNSMRIAISDNLYFNKYDGAGAAFGQYRVYTAVNPMNDDTWYCIRVQL